MEPIRETMEELREAMGSRGEAGEVRTRGMENSGRAIEYSWAPRERAGVKPWDKPCEAGFVAK